MKKVLTWLVFLLITMILSCSFFYFTNSDNSNEIIVSDEGKTIIDWGLESNFKINENIENDNEINYNVDVIDKLLNYFLDEEIKIIEEQEQEKQIHIKTPENVKSLYFSAHSINNKEKLDNFFSIAKNKEINSIMIDIKEVDWYVSFKLDDNNFWNIKPQSNNVIKNIDELIQKLHDNNIYIIARIAVFKDKRLATVRPDLAVKSTDDWAVWTDYKWYKYTDPYSKEVWDYHSEIAASVYDLWFDEINFDYVRFPTDGYISKTYYPFSNTILKEDYKWWKIKVIDKFSNYVTKKLRDYNSNIVLSADVFGLVTNTNMFQIWQNLESFLLSFDYVWPMVYPSHYWEWHFWFKYPDNNPYWVIKASLDSAIKKIDNLNLEIKNAEIEFRDIKLNEFFTYDRRSLTKKTIDIKQIRPYLQGFSCTRCANYTLYNREKFRQGVSAVNDSWIDSWWVRSSGSYYRDDRYD